MSVMIYQLGICDFAPSRMFIEPAGEMTLLELLSAAEEMYGLPLKMIAPEQGKLHEELAILIDGVSCGKNQGLDTKVKDGSSILITGIISGG